LFHLQATVEFALLFFWLLTRTEPNFFCFCWEVQ
jgi:hypothetical protein